MHLECPHCQASYDIDSGIEGGLFVCHRCGREFALHSQADEGSVEMELDNHGEMDDGDRIDASVAVEQPPQECSGGEAVAGQAPARKTAHIWPWLLTMLMLLAAGGFWAQRDAWLDNRWLRSTLTNIGMNMPMRAKDWRIESASVRPQWISRNDGSRVLLVHGVIDNLMRSEMPLPRIQLTFFSRAEPQKQLKQIALSIRLTPTDRQMHQVPYAPPQKDYAPVAALGKRAFTLVVSSMPAESGDFTLTPIVR